MPTWVWVATESRHAFLLTGVSLQPTTPGWALPNANPCPVVDPDLAIFCHFAGRGSPSAPPDHSHDAHAVASCVEMLMPWLGNAQVLQRGVAQTIVQ